MEQDQNRTGEDDRWRMEKSEKVGKGKLVLAEGRTRNGAHLRRHGIYRAAMKPKKGSGFQ